MEVPFALSIGIYTFLDLEKCNDLACFYAEGVMQRSPGLPDECRATLGTSARLRPNPEGVLQAWCLAAGSLHNPYRVGPIFCSVPG
jgi:hypothetical protein